MATLSSGISSHVLINSSSTFYFLNEILLDIYLATKEIINCPTVSQTRPNPVQIMTHKWHNSLKSPFTVPAR